MLAVAASVRILALDGIIAGVVLIVCVYHQTQLTHHPIIGSFRVSEGLTNLPHGVHAKEATRELAVDWRLTTQPNSHERVDTQVEIWSPAGGASPISPRCDA